MRLPSGPSDLDLLVQEWVQSKRDQGKKAGTVKLYRYVGEQFAAFCREAGIGRPDQVRTRHLERFAAWLREHPNPHTGQPLSEQTVKGRITHVGYFLHWLVNEGELETAPRLPKIHAPEVPKVPLQHTEMQRLMAAPQTSRRDQLVLEVLCTTGVRSSELCGLQTSDLDREGDRYYLRVWGKGDRPRSVGISVGLYRRLLRWVREEREAPPEEQHLFVGRFQPHRPLTPSGLRRVVREAGKRAGLPERLYTHLLRNSFATYQLADRHVPGMLVAEAMGHADERMLRKHYVRVSREAAHDAIVRELPEQHGGRWRFGRQSA